MIERKFVAENIKELQIREFIEGELSRVGLSGVKLQKTPLGEKIIISASRPGLVVGRGGSNINRLTKELKKNFDLENPQIEIEEVEKIGRDPKIIAEMIANSLERFGGSRFKGIGHKAMADVMQSGAIGVEILISGKVPSQRSRTWRFYQGYLKKCGDIALTDVKAAYASAVLKSGAVGVQVRIMPSDIRLPDDVKLRERPEEVIEEVEGAEKKAEEPEEKAEEAKLKKSTPKEVTEKKEENEDAKRGDEKAKKPSKKESKKTEKKDGASEKKEDKKSGSKKESEKTEDKKSSKSSTKKKSKTSSKKTKKKKSTKKKSTKKEEKK